MVEQKTRWRGEKKNQQSGLFSLTIYIHRHPPLVLISPGESTVETPHTDGLTLGKKGGWTTSWWVRRTPLGAEFSSWTLVAVAGSIGGESQMGGGRKGFTVFRYGSEMLRLDPRPGGARRAGIGVREERAGNAEDRGPWRNGR